MKVTILNREVRVECNGLDFLKLKSKIYKIIGAKLRTEKSFLIFPEICLLALRDELPDELFLVDEIARIMRRYDDHAKSRMSAINVVENGLIQGVPNDWLHQLDPAQAVAVTAMTLPGLFGLCLFDEQGIGKTVMTICAFDILKLQKSIDAMIVACPKTMSGEWKNDIERFLPGKYKVLVAEGDQHQRYDTALSAFDVLVTNYEGVEHMRIALSAKASRTPFLLVVDESYYLKNPESIRSETVLQLRYNCKKCYVLCGTPAPNSAYDLINQFDLADNGYTFGCFTKSKDTERDTARIEELVETRGTFIRRLKSEVFQDIPEKNFHIIRIPMVGRQALMYEKARSDLQLELRRLDNSTFKKSLATYFQKRSALLQICATPSSLDPTMTEPSVKMEYLDKLLSTLTQKERKVILWSYYKSSIDELVARYSKYHPLRIDGSIDTKTRRESVRLFQEDPSKLVFIGNPAAAGAGITLHASYDAVYVSYSNQAAHYLQSLDRIHRRGQKAKEVNYYLLVCNGTIEETEVLRLRQKELRQHSLLGDHIVWPASLDDALKELSHVTV